MSPLLLILLIGLAGGIAVGVQSPLASLVSQRLGMIESVFILHLGGALLSLIFLLFLGGGNLSRWRELPWYALGAGMLGLVVISSVSYMIPRIGIAASITTMVAGQLMMGAVLDHFGLLGTIVKPIDPIRVIGLLIVLAGVWLTVR